MTHVLVLDDDDDVRSFLVTALRRAGHAVEQAADGAAGLRLARARAFQVVVTDLRMPGTDGLTVLRTLREEQPEVEVVVLTAHGTVDVAVQAMREGAYDFLQKPLESPDALRLVVERAAERRALRDRTPAPSAGPALTWGAPAMVPVVRALERVARTDSTVLLTGESGTGKEVAARALHAWSTRSAGPFVAVNCASLSGPLLESELFGHERGAFTGADATRRGKLELAAGGTFLLDEIGELAPELQARLLRVLQERTFERVGGRQLLPADVRWIAATNRSLPEAIAAGRFREDLYHRLAVFPVHLPPLRERQEDLPALASALLARVAAELGRPDLRLGPDAVDALARHPWRGNVRELANVLERAAILSDRALLGARELDLPAAPATVSTGGGPKPAPTLEQAERQAIEAALALHDGHRERAARHLGMGVRTLYDKLRRHGLG